MSTVRPISAETLEQAPAQVLRFLRMVVRHRALWNVMATRGYSLAHHREGWVGLQKLAVPAGPEGAMTSIDPMVAAAEGALLLWDDAWLPIIGVVLEFEYPDQHAFLFAGGLAPVAGPESVLVVHTILDRLQALRTGAGRPDDQRPQDQRAVAALAAHGLTEAMLAEASELIRIYEDGAPVVELDPVAEAAARAARQAAEVAVYHWWKKWSTIARQIITRKDHLQWLGLATRKKPARPEKPSAEPA